MHRALEKLCDSMLCALAAPRGSMWCLIWTRWEEWRGNMQLCTGYARCIHFGAVSGCPLTRILRGADWWYGGDYSVALMRCDDSHITYSREHRFMDLHTGYDDLAFILFDTFSAIYEVSDPYGAFYILCILCTLCSMWCLINKAQALILTIDAEVITRTTHILTSLTDICTN